MTVTLTRNLLVAVLMLVAALAIFDIIPEQAAQYAPVALVALFPAILRCRTQRDAQEA